MMALDGTHGAPAFFPAASMYRAVGRRAQARFHGRAAIIGGGRARSPRARPHRPSPPALRRQRGESRKRQAGFSLIELMIVVVILAILAAVAYPLYTNYVDKSRRSAAVTALQKAASLEEKYYAIHNTYAGLDKIGYTADSVSVPSGKNWYTLTANFSPTTYLLMAKPVASGPQHDDKCGVYTLNSIGQRGSDAPVSACWGSG